MKTFGVRSQNSVLEIDGWQESAVSHIWVSERPRHAFRFPPKYVKMYLRTFLDPRLREEETFQDLPHLTLRKHLWMDVVPSCIFHLVFIHY